jgi:hypothetical protein
VIKAIKVSKAFKVLLVPLALPLLYRDRLALKVRKVRLALKGTKATKAKVSLLVVQ